MKQRAAGLSLYRFYEKELSQRRRGAETRKHCNGIPGLIFQNLKLPGVYIEYLTDLSKRSKINEIAGLEGGIAMANEVLMTISRDEEERARIMRAEKTELDYISYMAEAEEKGKLENEKYILQLIKQGLTLEEIKQYLEHKT